MIFIPYCLESPFASRHLVEEWGTGTLSTMQVTKKPQPALEADIKVQNLSLNFGWLLQKFEADDAVTRTKVKKQVYL